MRFRRPAGNRAAGRSVGTRDRVLPPLISISSVAIVVFLVRDAVIEVFPAVIRGFAINMSVWGVSLAAIALWALLLAVFRSLNGPWFTPLRVFTVLYVDLFRGLPSLLLVLLFGFGIPALQIPGLPRSSLFWGATAMIASYSAYAAEVYRSGIDAVHDGKRAAAKALGLSQVQTLRFSILPQALRNVLPSLLNLAVALQKDVALLSVLGIRDAVREAQIFTARTFPYSSLVAAALLFLVATVPMARLTDYVTRKDRERRLQKTT